MIYFIACPEANAVKIGVTKKRHWLTADASAFARLSSLKTACPFELELLAICEGGEREEAELHQRFAVDHIRGEWFRLTGRIEQHIAGFHRPIRRPRGWNRGKRATTLVTESIAA